MRFHTYPAMMNGYKETVSATVSACIVWHLPAYPFDTVGAGSNGTPLCS